MCHIRRRQGGCYGRHFYSCAILALSVEISHLFCLAAAAASATDDDETGTSAFATENDTTATTAATELAATALFSLIFALCISFLTVSMAYFSAIEDALMRRFVDNGIPLTAKVRHATMVRRSNGNINSNNKNDLCKILIEYRYNMDDNGEDGSGSFRYAAVLRKPLVCLEGDMSHPRSQQQQPKNDTSNNRSQSTPPRSHRLCIEVAPITTPTSPGRMLARAFDNTHATPSSSVGGGIAMESPYSRRRLPDATPIPIPTHEENCDSSTTIAAAAADGHDDDETKNNVIDKSNTPAFQTFPSFDMAVFEEPQRCSTIPILVLAGHPHSAIVAGVVHRAVAGKQQWCWWPGGAPTACLSAVTVLGMTVFVWNARQWQRMDVSFGPSQQQLAPEFAVLLALSFVGTLTLLAVEWVTIHWLFRSLFLEAVYHDYLYNVSNTDNGNNANNHYSGHGPLLKNDDETLYTMSTLGTSPSWKTATRTSLTRNNNNSNNALDTYMNLESWTL